MSGNATFYPGTQENTSGWFANQVKARRNSLKPTTTIVKKMPVIFTNNAIANGETTEKMKRRANELLNRNDLLNAKNILKPTTTKVTTAHAFTSEVQVPKTTIPKTTKRLEVENTWYEAHGHRGDKNWTYPKMITECDAEARPGYTSKKAHEYVDEENVLKEKVKVLAQMILKSKTFLVYTGAGISTSSGIGDYASIGTNSYIKRQQNENNLAQPQSPLLAQPTFAHYALAALHDKGFIKRWIQQNHDGLPQKAGYPQEKLNEIHGAWFDPSNPVVAMSGSLRGDLFTNMLEWEKKSDLVLSMGTSMCGMNSDRVFTTCSKKALENKTTLGGVIVNLQCTQFDHLAALRIFAPIDLVMKMLLGELKMHNAIFELNKTQQLKDANAETKEKNDVFSIPYDLQTGKFTNDRTILDLREGAKVKLTCGPYAGDIGEVTGKNRDGHYRIRFRHRLKPNRPLRMPFERLLGNWWVETLRKGGVDVTPIVQY